MSFLKKLFYRFELKLLSGVTAVTLVLTGQSVYSILDLGEKTRPQRQPASLPQSVMTSETLHQGPLEFDLDCERGSNNHIRIYLREPHLRLRGNLCDEEFQASQWELKNQSNGFTANLLASSSSRFTSDYIALEPGENRLQLHLRDHRGQPRGYEIQIVKLP